ncbi:cupin-like domain-containing protein [Agromyces sp. ISL-38]|uniref:cupin domain-containing protein n=1 Tax=Agromyces sp. ISL-38 TaxID=2819107 RepID=UPI001BEA72B7|nr:cupin domain-containing protein [Agromyces sp. ISL-38]MBT2499361.1 cupin-like domain-containing protein [Agromyces sp. ISL-38]MBT2518103.1 cupin-like domain-containing protein [Streptomyces sp. ISL-90]
MTRSERGPISRPALSRCIRVSAEEFAERYWGYEPLLSTADDLAAGFDDLFSAAAVDELVTRRGVRTPFIRMAQEGSVLAASAYTASGGFGAEIADQVSSDKVLAEFAGGATIVLQGLHRLWPPIIDFTRELIDDIGHPAQVNAYVTPPSSQGFDPHYDTHDVFVLQISGEKHWRIHAPVLVDPLRTQPWDQHRAAVARAATHEPVIDVVLRPGDAVYLPRGWIHSATALGATSVHLTVGMSAYTRADIVDALLEQVADNAALRASLPLGLDLRDPEALTPIVEQTVQALIETLQQTDASRPAAMLSSRFDAATRAEPVAPLATLEALATLDASTPVRWRGSLSVRIATADDRVRIVARTKTLSLPIEAEQAVRRLATGDVVTSGELPGLDAESAVVVVRRLLREGFVVAPA